MVIATGMPMTNGMGMPMIWFFVPMVMATGMPMANATGVPMTMCTGTSTIVKHASGMAGWNNFCSPVQRK